MALRLRIPNGDLIILLSFLRILSAGETRSTGQVHPRGLQKEGRCQYFKNCWIELVTNHIIIQMYKHDDPECSELCECNLGEVLSCKVLECIERDACNTDEAFYSHASPFYQAYRGQCLCYSGSFVCSKPPKGNFFLSLMHTVVCGHVT